MDSDMTTATDASTAPPVDESPLQLAQAEGVLPPSTWAVGAAAVGALALGALAIGALAIGAVVIGRLAVGRLAIGRARLGKVVIDELVVRRMRGPDQSHGGGGP
jgi:hypothetical protein